MNKKKFFITALVLVLLAGLVYLQVRTWRKFDWEKFWAVTKGQSFGPKLLFAPIPKSVLVVSERTIKKIHT